MGSISKNFGSNDAYTILLEWKEVSQSIANNQTKLTFTCTLKSNRSSATFTGPAKTDTLKVGGTSYSVSHDSYTVSGSGSVILWTKTITVTHGADGSYSKAVSAAVQIANTFSSSGYIGAVTASGNITCTTIPRASTLAFGSVVFGKSVPLTISRASSSFTHTITYTIGNATGTIVSKTTKASLSWSLPFDLAKETPNSDKIKCTLKITTYSGSTAIGTKTYDTTATVLKDDAAPIVGADWATVTWYNTGTAAASIKAFVQGYSKAQVTFDESKIGFMQGASLASYKISCNGVTDSASPYRTGVLTGTSATITCTVTDTRGFSTSTKLGVKLNAYSKPKLKNVSLYRGNSNGVANEAGTCIFAKATLTYSSIGGLNSCPLKGFYRLQSNTYGTSKTMESGVRMILTETASAASTYVAKITATDSLGFTAKYETIIPTDSVAFHLKPGGNGAAFGKYAEINNAVEIYDEWDLVLHGNAISDHIIAHGTEGDWEYVYYASGRKEAWYSVLLENVAFSASGNIYRSGAIAIPPPPSSKSTYSFRSIVVNGCGITQPVWFGQAIYGSDAYPNDIALRVFSATNTTQNVRLRVYACYR